MLWVAIKRGSITHYRRPSDTQGIYDLLEPIYGHDVAESIVIWCESAYYEDEYEADDPNLRVWFVDDLEQ